MKLSRKQFDILQAIIDSPKMAQRKLQDVTGYSLGTINKTMKELTDAGLVCDGPITDAGLAAMEPYKVKRALFIAAGFGSRLVPITLNTPKPLVRVNGKRMIDTLLDAVIDAGIEEIYIVRGYLGEQFDQLLYKYPNIKFIENPYYNEANNISSAFLVRHLMQNAYVLEADLVLSNPKLITKYQYISNYLGVPTDYTDDWCFETKNNVITTVKAQYHGDMSDPSKVTSEKVLCSNADSNEIELSYAVPYTNVTILVDTQEVSTPLNTDSKGNYLVYSYSDLCKMAEMVNSGYTKYTNGSYSLMNDIVCTGKVWTPIGTGDVNFGGTLNGNGKSIIGLNRDAGTADGNRQPLFNVVGKTATIDNVIFTGADVFSAEAPVKGSGVICKHNYGLIKNCLISDSDVQLGNWHYLGGVAGLNDGTIENCAVVNTSITRRWGGCSTHTMGGITETNNGTVKNCFTFNCGFNNGDVSRNSPIVSSGNAPENCYYYTGSNINKTYGTEKTIAQFNSGEVTYQLNNGVTNSEQSWYQCIGSDATPTLKSNGYDTVYKTENGTYTN